MSLFISIYPDIYNITSNSLLRIYITILKDDFSCQIAKNTSLPALSPHPPCIAVAPHFFSEMRLQWKVMAGNGEEEGMDRNPESETRNGDHCNSG